MDITPKTPWKERRIKSGDFLDRKLSADLLKAKRKNEYNIRVIEKNVEHNAFVAVVCIVTALLVVFLFSTRGHAYTLDEWANAIHKAEGNDNYGILTKRYGGNYRQVCKNTVRNTYYRWKRSKQDISFLQFLGNRYCPIGASNDSYGLNRFWISNVQFYLNKYKYTI